MKLITTFGNGDWEPTDFRNILAVTKKGLQKLEAGQSTPDTLGDERIKFDLERLLERTYEWFQQRPEFRQEPVAQDLGRLLAHYSNKA